MSVTDDRRRLADERVLLGGRWVHPRAKHGTANSYRRYGCRCESCSAAIRAESLARRAKTREGAYASEHTAHRDTLGSVSAFMRAAGQPVATRPTLVDTDLADVRARMLAEEVTEYCDAVAEGDLVEIGDGLADVVVVALGTMLTYFGERTTRKILAEVAASNAAKVDGRHGPVVWKSPGKVGKPEGWITPNVASVINNAPKGERK